MNASRAIRPHAVLVLAVCTAVVWSPRGTPNVRAHPSEAAQERTSSDVAGTIEATSGSVFIRRLGEQAWIRVDRDGVPFQMTDTIRTGPNSLVRLRFDDRATGSVLKGAFDLGPDTELQPHDAAEAIRRMPDTPPRGGRIWWLIKGVLRGFWETLNPANTNRLRIGIGTTLCEAQPGVPQIPWRVGQRIPFEPNGPVTPMLRLASDRTVVGLQTPAANQAQASDIIAGVDDAQATSELAVRYGQLVCRAADRTGRTVVVPSGEVLTVSAGGVPRRVPLDAARWAQLVARTTPRGAAPLDVPPSAAAAASPAGGVDAGDGYSVIANSALPGLNNELHGKYTVAQCKTLCTARPWCRSFDYEKAEGWCHLSGGSLGSAALRSDGAWDFFYNRGRLGPPPK